jgi:hypothetical protein
VNPPSAGVRARPSEAVPDVAPVARATTPEPTPAPPPTRAPEPTPAPTHLEGEGTLTVATSPWCRVVVDGVDRGTTPLRIKLPAGPHTLLLVNAEFNVSRSFPIVIEPGQTVRKRVDFVY